MSGLDVEAYAGDEVVLPLPLPEVEAAVRHALLEEGVNEAEISVAFVSDRDVGRLNWEYLSHEGPTDVISFPLHGEGQSPLGDIYVGADQARRQAEELGVRLEEELLRLAIHGTLHVLGYEHPEGQGREDSEMHRRQEEILASFLGRPRSDAS